MKNSRFWERMAMIRPCYNSDNISGEACEAIVGCVISGCTGCAQRLRNYHEYRIQRIKKLKKIYRDYAKALRDARENNQVK